MRAHKAPEMQSYQQVQNPHKSKKAAISNIQVQYHLSTAKKKASKQKGNALVLA
jgi:hypothetical protein